MPPTKSFQTEEQRRRAFEDAGIVDTTILEPTADIEFEEPEIIPPIPPPVVDTTAPAEPTPKEKGISEMIEELTATTGLAGEKETFRIEQEEAAGLEGLRKAEADYTAQLQQLEAEFKNVEHRMQIEAEGRGITKAGLAPLTMGEQRKIAIQANTVTALLAAAQGKVTFAQSQVDRAVKNKYAQDEADRKAKIENLTLLLKDPTLTLEQENRANAQLAAQEKEEAGAKEKEANSITIMDWAIKASEAGATPEQAQAIATIGMSDDPDLEQAFALYSPLAKKEPTGDVKTFKQFFPDVDVTTPEGRQQFLDWQAKTAAAKREPDIPLGMQTAADYFSPTQISAGAFNAGMDIGEFGKLSIDEANKYVRGEEETDVQKSLDLIKDTFQQYKDAGYEKDEVEQQFLAENKLDALPTPIRERLDETFPEEGEGFWSDAWSWLTGK